MNFVKSSYLSAISTAVSLITKVVVNKITALYIGPNGFAIYGQFKDFVSLISSIGQLGTENGIIKYTADTKNDINKYKRFLATAFKLHIASALLISLFILIFRSWINQILFADNSFAPEIIIVGCSTLFISLHNLFLGILNGLKLLKEYITVSIISTLAIAVTASISVKYYGLSGLIFSIGFNHLLLFIISLFFISSYCNISISIFKEKFQKHIFRGLIDFSAMSLSGIISLSVALLFIRTLIINNLGDNYAGSWDALWRISAIYILFLTSSFKFYLIPTFSTLEDSLLKQEILKIWRITLPSILVIISGIYIFKDFIIQFLFTEEFLLIKSIILYQLLGDIFRIHSWTLGNLLMAKKKTKIFITLQVVWAILFCSLGTILSRIYGFKGITLAYLITCVFHFAFLNISLKNELWIVKKY